MFTNNNPNGDSLNGANISTYPKYRHEGIGSIALRWKKATSHKIEIKKNDSRWEIIQLLQLFK
jgi:hypothetical protein